jgi:formylglycine-generating enzyme required for sulfatase activity
LPVQITNSIGMKLVLIPPGEFVMGHAEKERRRLVADAPQKEQVPFRTSEGPQHPVRLTEPYYLGVCEATLAEFRTFVEATGHKTDCERRGGGFGPYKGVWGLHPELNWTSPGFPQGDNQPVVLVSLNDARVFCEWLSKREGRQYAIPTEAQWEYACRADSDDLWPFGNQQQDLEQYAWYDELVTSSTHAVGQKLPNAFGTFDMLGNALEWTNDWYGEDYYAVSPRDNPQGPAFGTKSVVRGGCFKWTADLARPATRCFAFPPHSSWHDIGFRVVLKIPEDAEQTQKQFRDSAPEARRNEKPSPKDD